MINIKSFLNELFEMKADKLYSFNKKDKEEQGQLKNNNVILKDIYNTIEHNEMSNTNLKSKIDKLIDSINIECSHREKKIYKVGFSDAVKMMIEITKF